MCASFGKRVQRYGNYLRLPNNSRDFFRFIFLQVLQALFPWRERPVWHLLQVLPPAWSD
jgi:hypothetical protein